jgi:hypothetical protein
MCAGARERRLGAMTTIELHHQLQALSAERAAASLAGLDSNELYMGDLREEIEAVHDAFVGAAVTEIASLRAQLDGPLLG